MGIRLLWVVSLALATASSGRSQGLSGAVVSGRVVDNTGAALVASVRLTDTATGMARETRSDDAGRFRFDNVPPRSTYTIVGRVPGFTPRTVTLTPTSLGEFVSVTIVLQPRTATTLEPVIVQTGVPRDGTMIPSSTLRRLPLLNRDFTGLFRTLAQGTGRTTLSIAGQHPGLNAIQFDGFVANDVYGVTRTPGEAAGATSMSLEAIDQVRVLISPFDVRQGAFTGGLLNAVTRSGTNTWRAEFFSSLQAPILVGPDTSGAHINDFSFQQYGLTLGGPIVRDRAHVFIAADMQRSRTPFVGPEADAPGTGISLATAQRVADAFRSRYGIDAGGPEAPVLSRPGASVLARLDWQVAPSHVLTAWRNTVRSRDGQFNREARNRPNRDGWQLSRSGSTAHADVDATRLRLTSMSGRVDNELLIGTQTTREWRVAATRSPLFLIGGDMARTWIAGGADRAAQDTRLDQRFTEVTDNATWTMSMHAMTAGVHVEWFSVTDHFFPASWGTWTFPSVASFESGLPERYEISLPLRPGGPTGRFHVRSMAGYLQDQWALSDHLSLSLGVRLDRYSISSPRTNSLLLSDSALGLTGSGSIPSGRTLVSPRAQLTWFIHNDGSLIFHAGIGDFSGRPPYVWMGNAFISTGLDAITLICNPPDGVPPPVTDITRLPQECTDSTQPMTTRAAAVTLSPDLRFPKVRKLVAGVDARLREGLSLALEASHTRSLGEPYLVDINLAPGMQDTEGRELYGTISQSGISRPTRLDSSAFGQVLQYRSTSGGTNSSILATLTWQGAAGRMLQASYQWSRSRDVQSMLSPNAFTAMQNAPLDGPIGSPTIGTSLFDVPHSLAVTGMTDLPGGAQLTLLLRAQSGRPFTWVASGDANADGVSGNDALYVPLDQDDIILRNPELWSALDTFIRSHPCLRSQRGRIVRRNSCRNPGFLTLDARIEQRLPLADSRATLSVDVFNVPNLLRHSWGLVRETTSRPQKSFLLVSGFDAGRNRPIYAVPNASGVVVLPSLETAVIDASRWRCQVTLRLRP